MNLQQSARGPALQAGHGAAPLRPLAGLAARRPGRVGTMIDASLARGIRGAYLRTLDGAWNDYSVRVRAAQRRNGSLAARINSEKALDARWATFTGLLGGLLPISTVHLNANSRGARVMLSLEPEAIPGDLTAMSGALVVAKVFMRPTAVLEKTLPIHVAGHAIERVIQRSRLIALPIGRQDILAIHAEFADALPLACIAHDALRQAVAVGTLADVAGLNILLPSANGVFLCSWDGDAGMLLVKTFIGRSQLNQAELAAIDELQRFGEAQVAAHLLDGLAPGWLGLETRDLHTALLRAWRHFGWRLDEEVRLPGMSDAAWASRPPSEEISA